MSGQKKSPRPDFRNTFYIFPVFLPLAELLPWLLSVIAALAAFSQFISRRIWQNPVRRALLLTVSALCLVAAGFLVWQRWSITPDAAEGSYMVKPAEFSTLESIRTIPTQANPPAAKPLTLLWEKRTPHQIIGKPSVAGNLLMAGTYSGTLDAFSTRDGSAVWSLHKKEQIFSTAVVNGNIALIGEGHHTSPTASLTRFSFPDGKPVWERRFGSHLESYPVVDTAKNILWLTAGETGLWALAFDTGTVIWWSRIGHSDIPPLLSGGSLFAVASHPDGTEGSAWQELDPVNGRSIKSLNIAGHPMCNLLPDDKGNMYFATATGQVGVTRGTDRGWAHSITTQGKLRWSVQLPAMPMPEGVLLGDGSLLFYTLSDGTLIALHTSDGSTAWQAKPGNSFNTDAALMENGPVSYIVAVTGEGYVTLRNARNGKEEAHFNIEKSDSYPIYDRSVLYIASPWTLRAYAGIAP